VTVQAGCPDFKNRRKHHLHRKTQGQKKEEIGHQSRALNSTWLMTDFCSCISLEFPDDLLFSSATDADLLSLADNCRTS